MFVLIDEQTKKRLIKKLSLMKRTVKVLIFLNESHECEIVKQLMKELAEISDHKIKPIFLNLNSKEAKIYRVKKAVTVFVEPGKYKIIYKGAPLGQEVWAFIETIVQVSRDESKLSDKSKEKLKALDKIKRVQILVTKNCPYCPYQVLLANKLAIEAKGKVIVECINLEDYPEIAREYNVTGVPMQVINGRMVSVGVQSEEKFVKDVTK